MSQAPKKKKVVVTTKSKKAGVSVEGKKRKVRPTTPRAKMHKTTFGDQMLYNRENFKWIFIGLGLIAIGMLLMMGGSMPSPDVWDESTIYSFRRITLAPIVILAGLGLQVYAIFK